MKEEFQSSALLVQFPRQGHSDQNKPLLLFTKDGGAARAYQNKYGGAWHAFPSLIGAEHKYRMRSTNLSLWTSALAVRDKQQGREMICPLVCLASPFMLSVLCFVKVQVHRKPDSNLHTAV